MDHFGRLVALKMYTITLTELRVSFVQAVYASDVVV